MAIVLLRNSTNFDVYDRHKCLGIELDKLLSFDEAVNNAYSKANRKLFTLMEICPYINQCCFSYIRTICPAHPGSWRLSV